MESPIFLATFKVSASQPNNWIIILIMKPAACFKISIPSKANLQCSDKTLNDKTPRGELSIRERPACHTAPVQLSARTQSCSSFSEWAAWVSAVEMHTYHCVWLVTQSNKAFFHSSPSVAVLQASVLLFGPYSPSLFFHSLSFELHLLLFNFPITKHSQC